MHLRRLVFVALMMFLPAAAAAQDAAALVADRVQLTGNTSLEASGNVEVFYRGTRLQATRILFDRSAQSLQIDGPIIMTEGDKIVILADSATLDQNLQNGIMTGARIVMDQQLQLAATQINRVGGRYTQMYQTVASSCQVCAENPVPLWQIRAERIIHDQDARQLYFDRAQLRIMDIPVFYLPRLRLPDPTLKRANGFLRPSVRTTSKLGFGLKVPYFKTIGDHADLTMTPYLSSKTRTVELRYRQAFRSGDVEINGAISDDDVRPGSTRSYIFANGNFSLRNDFKLNLKYEDVSDQAYLLDYGYSAKDRLDSSVELTRTRRDEYISAQFIRFESLRAADDNRVLPTDVGAFLYERRFEPSWIGGEFGLVVEAHGYHRRSQIDIEGRDVTRTRAALDWHRSWALRNGMIATARGQANADLHIVNQDSNYPTELTQLSPFASVELRWPWSKTTSSGVGHVIEPVAQLVWSDEAVKDVPDEESRFVELDEGNLYSLSRFPGSDRYERGVRANLGVTYTRYDPNGWTMGVTVGRILRENDLGQFQPGTGLSGDSSDWLAAVQLKLPGNLSVTNRALFDNEFDFTKNETRAAWANTRVALASSYIWAEPEPAESRYTSTSEWTMDTAYRMTRNWTGKANWRYDFTADQTASAGLGLEYRTECMRVDLSLSRRFTTSTSVTPTTNFGLSVELTGFGSSTSDRSYARSCAR